MRGYIGTITVTRTSLATGRNDEHPIDNPISCTSSIYIDWIY